MAYKSAAQQTIEDLQSELRERDRRIADLMTAQADAALAAARKKAEQERDAALAEQRETARRQAWRWHNFEQFARERPHDQPDWTAIDHIGEGWPAGAEQEWRDKQPTLADVAPAPSLGDTKLGRELKLLETAHARLKQAT